MKVSNPKRVTQAYSGTDRGTSAVTAVRPAARQLNDRASVMGIPETEFTPNVQNAVSTLMEEIDRLKHDLDTSHRKVEELETMADEDPLVAVLNRRAFERELTRSLAFVKRYEAEASLLFIDLNGFKQINDQYGHAAGDAVLKRVGELLSENVRQSDLVGRLGGDEFGVVLVQTSHENARHKADALVELINQATVEVDGVTIALSVAAGAAVLDGDKTAAALIAEADHAMYQDKAARQSA